MPTFSTVSAQRLLTCDHRLQRLFGELIKQIDFSVIDGHRDKAAQDAAFATGHSRCVWPASAHNALPSRAVDVMPCPIDWDDIQRLKEFAVVVKEQAARLGISVIWGGDYHSFKDWDHWELAE